MRARAAAAFRAGLGSIELRPRAGQVDRAGRVTAGPRLEQVEYVSGPRNRESEARAGLPSEIPGPDGTYVRSVRCADDGAMRYVWQGSGVTDVGPHADMATEES